MKVLFFALLFVFVPYALHAQVTLFTIITMINGVMVGFVRLGVAIAVVVFVLGIVKMMLAMNRGDGDKAIQEGKKQMMWGIIAIFLIVSIWGVVTILSQIIGVQGAPDTLVAPVIQMP